MNRPSKGDIRILLQTAIANAKGAYGLLELHDNALDREADEPEDLIASRGQYMNQERMRSSIGDLESVLHRVDELIGKGFK